MIAERGWSSGRSAVVSGGQRLFASASERTLGKDDDRRVAVVLVDAATPPAGDADPLNAASGRVADVRHVLWQEQAAEQAVGFVQIVG